MKRRKVCYATKPSCLFFFFFPPHTQTNKQFFSGGNTSISSAIALTVSVIVAPALNYLPRTMYHVCTYFIKYVAQLPRDGIDGCSS